MTVYRLDWQAAAAAGDTVEIGVLIAGLPYLIVGDGVTVSAITWTDTADSAWHVGTSPTTRGWLDQRDLLIEERIRPVDGGIDVSSITLRLADIDLGVSALLGGRDGLAVSSLLTGITASATSIGIRSTASMASSGVAHIGRERITYTGKTGTSITGVTRGTAGTKARRHQVTPGYAPPKVYQGDALPFTLGRRVTVWALRITSAGTATDPTLIYDGRIGPGTRMSDAGAAWEIPVDHASKALAETTRPTELYLYGYSHFTEEETTTNDANRGDPQFTPLVSRWAAASSGGVMMFLNQSSGYPNSSGWSASAAEFVRRWNSAARTIGGGLSIQSDTDGHYVEGFTSPGRRLRTWWAWSTPHYNVSPTDPGDVTTRARVNIGTPTEACIFLREKIHLDAVELALVPAAPTPVTGLAMQWGLDVERDNDILPKETLRVIFSGDDGTNLTGVRTIDEPGREPPNVPAGGRIFGAEILLSRPVRAPLRLWTKIDALSVGWWDAIRYGVIDPIDELRGLDHIQDSIAWDRIEALASRSQPWNWERAYWTAPELPPLNVLRDEAALSGMLLCTWRGRISVAVVRDPSLTETVARTITQADLRRGQHATMREVSDGIISSVKLILPPHHRGEPTTIRVVDATAVSESGAGAEITVRVAEGATRTTDPMRDPALRGSLEVTALGLIAPWTRPYRLVTVPTDLRYADIEVGDVVSLAEWVLPSGSGGRGITGRGVVVGHRKDYRGGRVDVMLRVTAARAGWAPAYAVDSISGDEVTLDDPYPSSAAGFATDYTSDGAVRSDCGLEYLAVGDEVRLVEIGARSPTTPVSATVTDVDSVLKKVTLDVSPGATWETLATSGYGKVLIIPAKHASSTTAQRLYVYLADGSTVTLSTGDRARTWA